MLGANYLTSVLIEKYLSLGIAHPSQWAYLAWNNHPKNVLLFAWKAWVLGIPMQI